MRVINKTFYRHKEKSSNLKRCIEWILDSAKVIVYCRHSLFPHKGTDSQLAGFILKSHQAVIFCSVQEQLMFFLCLYLFHIKAVCEGTGIFLIMVIFQKAFHVLFMLSLVLCSAGFVFLSLCFCRFFCFLKLKAINFVNPFFFQFVSK